MGIKHTDVKAPGEKGFASEWNKNHGIDGDIDMGKNQFLSNVIENRTDWPAGPVEGQIVYRTDRDECYIFDGTAWESITMSPPIGSVQAWLKSYTNTPALAYGWVECNGQVLSDADSVYNGQTIPHLNGATATTHYFLRGNATSGSTGGIYNNDHTHTVISSGTTAGAGVANTFMVYDSASAALTNLNNQPPYYDVVWIMRVK